MPSWNLRWFSNNQDNSAEVLAVVEFAYNNGQHASTHMFPFFASYESHPGLFPLALSNSLVSAVDTFLQELKAVHQVVRSQMEKAKEDYK